MRLVTTALKLLLVALLALLSPSPASGVSTGNYIWISHGPGGGLVQALAIDPQAPGTVYAETLGSVFISTNGGATWGAINSALTNTYARALSIEP